MAYLVQPMPETTMSLDNKTMVQNLYAAMKNEDLETVLGHMSPDVRWIEPAGWISEGIFTGPTDVASKVFEPALSTIDDLQVVADTFLCDGDRVVALGHFTGIVEGTPINVRFAHIWTLQNEMVIDFENISVTGPVAGLFS